MITYFNRVRIINLANRKKRKKETIQEFKRFHFPIETEQCGFFEAISPDQNKGFSSNGVYGCFLSHMAIIKKAIDDDVKNILIIEDDICFTKNIIEFGNISIHLLNNMKWDIVYFGHMLGSVNTAMCWKKVDQSMITSHFYALNKCILKEYYAWLLQLKSRPRGHKEAGLMHYDGALSTFILDRPHVNAYYFSKNLGYQRPSKTDIHKTSVIDRSLILRPIAPIYRYIKYFFLKLTC